MKIFYDLHGKRKRKVRWLIISFMSIIIIFPAIFIISFFIKPRLTDLRLNHNTLNFQQANDQLNSVALTFDDGPDPIWTPQILDILKREQVSATFFIVGQNGLFHPSLISRILNEGHDIGNHSFTHRNLFNMPDRMIDLELNATQNLIEAITSRSTHYLRPPFLSVGALQVDGVLAVSWCRQDIFIRKKIFL